MLILWYTNGYIALSVCDSCLSRRRSCHHGFNFWYGLFKYSFRVLPAGSLPADDQVKNLTNNIVLKQNFYDLRYNKLADRIAIFTDGSKAENRVGAAAVVKHKFFVRRLPDGSSVYSAELTALELALNYILESHHSKFVIFSDSLSSLKALKGYSFANPILQIVIQKYLRATTDFHKDIVFCWVPSHVGIYGNELADFTAKAALEANLSHTLVPYTDYRG